MKGNNELHLCQAEMITAVEHYLNTLLFKEKVKVDSVKAETKGYTNGFIVQLVENKEVQQEASL